MDELVLIGAAPARSEVEAAGYRPRCFHNAVEAARFLAGSSTGVALVDGALADLATGRLLRDACEHVELVVAAPAERLSEALARSGDVFGDFLLLPAEAGLLRLRVDAARRRGQQRVQRALYELSLEERVLTRTREVWEKNGALRRAFLATIEALETALESKHEYTEGHSRRVASLSVRIARELGLASAQVEHVRLAALFHDIGKIGIRDDVLNKEGPLTDEERRHIERHPLIAERILAPLEGMRDIIDMIKFEHERFDGTGYPCRLSGEAIPLGARIIATADAYDALVTTRSYRAGTTPARAIEEIRRHAGTQFDPSTVEALWRVFEQDGAS